MKIEWNRVTWYSKALAVLIFVATFFIGLWFGSIYQQAKDYSSTYSSLLQSVSVPTHNGPNGTGQPSVSQSTSTNATSTTGPTYYNGMLVCKDNGGCPSGSSCMQPGPMVAGQQTPKVCVPNNQAIPL